MMPTPRRSVNRASRLRGTLKERCLWIMATLADAPATSRLPPERPDLVLSMEKPAMNRPNTCPPRARGAALAVALTAAAALTFAVVQTAWSLLDLAAAVHLGA
jgi:hypothetical protein